MKLRRSLVLLFLLPMSCHAFSLSRPIATRTVTLRQHTGTSPTWLTTQCCAQKEPQDKQEEGVGYLLQEFVFYDGSVVDPYRTLKVDRTANRAAIRTAYRTLSRAYHPDARLYDSTEILPGSCNNEQEVRDHWERINWSYALLMDPPRRKKYDRHMALADPGKALQRAAWQAAWNGVSSIGAGLWNVGSFAVSAVMEQQQSTADSSRNSHASAVTNTTSAGQPN